MMKKRKRKPDELDIRDADDGTFTARFDFFVIAVTDIVRGRNGKISATYVTDWEGDDPKHLDFRDLSITNIGERDALAEVAAR